MLDKEKVIQSIQEMPEQFSIDDLMDRLILLQKIEIGVKHSNEGNVYSTEEAKSLLKKWSK